MKQRDEDTLRVRPRAPRSSRREAQFLEHVLTRVRRASPVGGKPKHPSGRRGRAHLHRGAVAAAFVGARLDARSRRVVIKTRLVLLRGAASRGAATHLRYLAREGTSKDGERGRAYNARGDAADLPAFAEGTTQDRHQFRFIISPEDAGDLEDLRPFTRELMARMETDLGTALEWVAVDHWDTDHPHIHVVLRGTDQNGRDLVIDRDYLTRGMRLRSCELATEWLGPRTELEIQKSQDREVDQERWTGLDRALRRQSREGLVDLRQVPDDNLLRRARSLLLARLQRLEALGVARKLEPARWRLSEDLEHVLQRLGERGDIVRTLQRAFHDEPRELAVFNSKTAAVPLVGRVAAKGLADELRDRAYLVIDGLDGRGHYTSLPAGVELTDFPVGGIVEIRKASERVADRNIAALAQNGWYQPEAHLAQLRADRSPSSDPDEVVAGHVRRLEALRRRGIVERVSEGLWRVPSSLVERGRAYDRERLGGAHVVLHSHLPIEQQVRAIGATWLDRQLVAGVAIAATDRGFGARVQDAMRARQEFLVGEGFAERQGSRVVVARDLLRILRERELETATKSIADETGLVGRSMADGAASGIYRRSLLLASGRFAMLEDGLGFSLVPWRPVIEHRLGQHLSAVVRGEHVVWHVGRSRAPTL